MKYRSRSDIGIWIQGYMLRYKDELSTAINNAAMTVAEKLTYM